MAGLDAGRLLYQHAFSASVRAASLLGYTVQRIEIVFDAEGHLKGSNLYIEAVRADGSRVWETRTANAQSRRIHFANGDVVKTSDLAGLKSTYPGALAGGDEMARDPQASCITAKELASGWSIDGQDSVAGNRAARVKYAPQGFTLTLWYGLDVNCALLQQQYQDSHGVSRQNLTSLRVAEPDSSLFAVPATMTEVPPSALSAAPLTGVAQQRMDQPYYALRQAK